MIRRTAAIAAALIFLAGCGSGGSEGDPASEAAPTETNSHTGHSTEPPPEAAPLRDGEWFEDVTMPAAYTPSAPYDTGTDDYRCFLLDPELDKDAFITGIDVKPGHADVVHHVILFRVSPEQLDLAKAADSEEEGQGWTCFGGSGLGSGIEAVKSAPWIGAWAPGGGEQVHADDVGIPLTKGSQIVMQVHYNLLAGDAPDTSGAQLRLAPGNADLSSLETVLLAAPIELPCRDGHPGELCERDQAIADVEARFGPSGRTGDYLHYICGPINPGNVQSCTRGAPYDMTIRAVAGHMHLLGQKISVDAETSSGLERVLQIDNWNFDDQGADPVDPVSVSSGDALTVTCKHSQVMRDRVPQLKDQPERYVVWGEGTTDEMCLGVLLVTRD